MSDENKIRDEDIRERDEAVHAAKWEAEAHRWHDSWLELLNERDRLRRALEVIANINSYKKYDQNRHVSYLDYELRKIAQDALLLDHDRVSSTPKEI
jgi:hypothetical protein